MNFASPPTLLLIIPAAVLVILSFRGTKKVSFTQLLGATLRFVTMSLLVAALAGPYRTKSVASGGITAIVDISSSITPEVGDALLLRTRKLATELSLPLQFVPFANNAAPAAATDNGMTFDSLRRSWERLDIGGSNLERGFSSPASSSLSRVLFLSDGYETSGDVISTFRSDFGGQVFPLVPPMREEQGTVELSQLYAPLVAPAQKSVDIRATISNTTSETVSARLEIRHGKNAVYDKPVSLAAGRDIVISAESDPSLEELNEITAVLSWQSPSGPRVSTKTIWLAGEKRDKVLLINGSQEDDRFLSKILKGTAYQLKSVSAGENLGEIGPTSGYRSIILNNIHREALPDSLVRELPGFVRSGGGFIMVGGNKSFGLGGYIDSPIEEILPVKMVPPYTEKKRLNVAVQLVLDKSRSMAAENRLEFAKTAANEVVANLKDDDYIGIIGFDDTPFIALPLGPVGDVRDQAANRISRLYPARRTQMFPALDEGRRALMRVNAGRKHMIVLTDGKIPDPGDYYLDLVRQMRAVGITVSTVLVGTESDDGLLKDISEKGGGSFYQTSDPSSLPRIFLSDVRVGSGERSLQESSDYSARSGPDGLKSATVTPPFPPLRGYVQTTRRDGAALELVVLGREKAEPLLASWSVGKGRAVAFTSDANGRWSSSWISWPDIAPFWSDVVESTMPKNGEISKRFPFDLRSWVERGELVVDLSLYEDPEGAPVTGVVTMPDGSTRTIEFSTLGPGRFQSRVANPTAGKYVARLSVGKTELPTTAWYLPGELFGERTFAKPNAALLDKLATMSGGKVDPNASDLASFQERTKIKDDISRSALLLALLAFLLEILVREVLPALRLRKNAPYPR